MGVGKQLRLAREARGLTVRDVAELTKIPSRQIDAIETERYEKLPGGIFGRGYVRAVAVAVKLDPDPIVRAYQEETGSDGSDTVDRTQPAPSAGSEGRPVSVPPWRTERVEPRLRLAPIERERWLGPRLLAAVLIGIGVILLIIWLGRDRTTDPMSHAPAQPAGSPVASAPHGGTPQPIGTTGQLSHPRSSPAVERGTEVRLEAERACWVVLTVDGERVAYRILQPGEVVHATMRSGGTLRTGDAGALRLAIGADTPKPVGPSGAVRTIELRPPVR